MLTMGTNEILRAYFGVKLKGNFNKNCPYFSLEKGALLEALLLKEKNQRKFEREMENQVKIKLLM